jgi:DNA-directed RNA polymerase subunit K/omega
MPRKKTSPKNKPKAKPLAEKSDEDSDIGDVSVAEITDNEDEGEDEDTLIERIVNDDKDVGSDYEEIDVDDATVEVETKEELHSSAYYRTINVVPDNKRMTSDIMTMFEFSEVVGIRMQQIAEGGQVFTDTANLVDPHDMAIKELFDRKCPLKIIRKLNKFTQEEWKVNEMGFPADVRSGF